MIKEIFCNNLALSIRIGGHSTGAQWILVSPQMGDIETLLITENLLLYGKNYDFFLKLPTAWHNTQNYAEQLIHFKMHIKS